MLGRIRSRAGPPLPIRPGGSGQAARAAVVRPGRPKVAQIKGDDFVTNPAGAGPSGS